MSTAVMDGPKQYELHTSSESSSAQQYALPIHQARRVSGSREEGQEDQLRRKTPSGTIVAGYEGDISSNPHKHKLMPLNHTIRYPFQAQQSSKQTFVEHLRRQDERRKSSPTWLMSSQGSMPMMDSVLDQVPSYQHGQTLYPSTVPSVIQPSFPFIGPTAIGGHGNGPYGPYYYDGTFVPYRAAAVRDPRLYNFKQQPLWPAYRPPPHQWPTDYRIAVSPLAPGWTSGHQSYALPVPVTSNPQSFEETYGPESANAQQRDRTHAWALQQYRDLLQHIHHMRRQQQQARQNAGEPQVIHRPSFYPKPPTAWQKQRSLSSGNIIANGSGIVEQKTVWSPNGVHMHDNEYQRRASHDEHRKLSLDASHRLRRSSTSISPIMAPVAYDNSPQSRALLALSHITKLCQDDDWQWIDGMHLGGCLAYGLGNYHKAFRWYRKVLDIEPGHLEVMSNLAATLLALGQKDDAEQYWTKVVRAAPNHFEAVEHLVGLLCQQGRSKDAISIIEYVQQSLHQHPRVSSGHTATATATATTTQRNHDTADAESGFGDSGFAVPAADNGRVLALIHAKGNMLYALGGNAGAAKAFEDAVLIAAGHDFNDIQQLIDHILQVVSSTIQAHRPDLDISPAFRKEPILLTPEQALQTARFCFPPFGQLPGLAHVPGGEQSLARRAMLSTTSNSLLSLAKIYQDGISNPARAVGMKSSICSVRDILALYYLSLSLQPSPSTANNVGILLASVQQVTPLVQSHPKLEVPGVVPGSGIALALQYYNYGLQLDKTHAHLYTNLGSLLKDIGQLDAAVAMYQEAVKCDPKFDIALANLANAVKDKGRISDAITYYKRAVEVNTNFAEAVCGLANALNSVCNWHGRGGLAVDGGRRDRWHVDVNGMLIDAKHPGASSSGWISKVVDTVEKQLADGEHWGKGVITANVIDDLLGHGLHDKDQEDVLRSTLNQWSGTAWEGARYVRLLERAIRRIGWQWYQDLYVHKRDRAVSHYKRPQVPSMLTIPTAPTVLPFHTFTCPMSAKQIRLISQRNGLRITMCALKSPWLSNVVFRPPKPPTPHLKVGYISSDFNNHPLAHLMQSVFGLHSTKRVLAHCYATTPSDNSVHRQQIEKETPVFHDASQWSSEKLVKQIIDDGIHILVNLNGYTRGARNEVFAARPAPLQISFMGFAGTLGAEWCDYLLADETAIPKSTLRAGRRNAELQNIVADNNHGGSDDNWVYGENIIYCRDTFFCCDHKQSNASAKDKDLTWADEQQQRWQMRKELFPQLVDSTIIFGNFNQLYKIDPTTFRTWLRILARVPNSILWLLRFPDLGESHLLATAKLWAGAEVASRVIFTDVAPKHLHISRARVCDLVLDTAECNAHTTAADVLWSGTPLLTLPRYEFKMCSRIAASILKGALPKGADGVKAAEELIASSEDDYEDKAVKLAQGFSYDEAGIPGQATGRLMELRKLLFQARWTSALFDTARWVRDLEDAYDEAWKRYVSGKGGDIWLNELPSTKI